MIVRPHRMPNEKRQIPVGELAVIKKQVQKILESDSYEAALEELKKRVAKYFTNPKEAAKFAEELLDLID